METSKIKSFAKEARILLIDGVLQRLKYWGFEENGTNNQDLQTTQGGFVFRGEIYTDTSVPAKWETLKKRLTNKQAVQDVIEQAAYTWFNRLIAVKVLEENGYIEETLAFTEGMRTPQIVQNAKKGIHQLAKQADKDLLLEYLREDKEEQAFGLLMTDLCNRNQLLHDIFGRIDDFTEILLPQNLLQKDGLLDLINSDAISSEAYKEVELIGWLYQFYISDKKDEVFKGFKQNRKARAEDIPAATQIFTPKWIVKYMVENTVGKIYLDYEPDSQLLDEMKYLVLNDSDKDVTSSEVEKKSIISDLTELTLIDPASGSGHILVTGFELLFKMYREEGYTATRAVDSILEHNLFGLDIDERAMQLARFAVLLKAAQFDADVLNRGIIPHVYSFPEASHFTSEELQNFLGHEGHQFTAELKEALQLLNQGKNIGSALKLELNDAAQNHIKKQYEDWLLKSKRAGLDIEQSSVWNRLQPFLDVLLVLSKKYASVVANPPYMGQRNMNNELKAYVSKQYKNSKSDLLTVFIEVINAMNQSQGRSGMITLHGWMFTSTYAKLREWLISKNEIDSLIHVGRGLFGSDSGSVVFCIKKNQFKGGFRLYKKLFIKEVNVDSIDVKEKRFFDDDFGKFQFNQSNFFKIPGFGIAYWLGEAMLKMFELDLSDQHIQIKQGLATTENKKFLRLWSEVNIKNVGFNLERSEAKESKYKWFPYNKGGDFRKWYGNQIFIVDWSHDGAEIKSNVVEKYPYLNGNTSFVLKETNPYFQESVSWTDLSWTVGARYYPKGFLFDVSGHSTFYSDERQKLGCLAYLNTRFLDSIAKVINSTFHFQIGDFKKTPYPEEFIQSLNIDLVRLNINISKKDWDSRETSWDFEKSPLINNSVSLNKAYEIWYDQVNEDFFQLHANEEELNRIFIDIYGLQEELTPEVALKDITILQDELDRKALEALEPIFRKQGKNAVNLPINKAEVISQFLSYGIGVFLGRYRLDKPGLNIAHPTPTEEETAKYQYNGHPIEIDEDGILPLMGEDCAFPDDSLVRTKDLLHAVWGEGSLTENINFIHEALGMDLHKWFNEKFWKFHTVMYKKKPIYWLFSSNAKSPQKAAFKVLVYMHRMDKYTVQKIQRNYLHPHQEYIKQNIESLVQNEEDLNKQEIKQLEKLRNWELECRDYNEVLKQLAVQEIEIDLDDGVSVNYEKFEGALAVIK